MDDGGEEKQREGSLLRSGVSRSFGKTIMSQSAWPFDHSLEPRFAAKTKRAAADLDVIDVFVICPSRPIDYFDDLFSMLQDICSQIGKAYSISVRCTRAIDIRSSGLIHPEIWQGIRCADVVVADLTGLNGNVLYELGVAAAWHPKQRVIVIRERTSEATTEQWLFDIQPVRHLTYIRTHRGLGLLTKELGQVLIDVVAAAPFEQVDPQSVQIPTTFDLSTSDPPELLTPGPAHRRLLGGRYLEFGSLNNFRYCWISVGSLRVRNIIVKAKLGFSKLGSPPEDMPWLGVSVRSQSFWANHGHLAYIRKDGSVWVTLEKESGHADQPIGRIDHFKPGPSNLLELTTRLDNRGWHVSVDRVTWHMPLEKMPFVFSDGRILVQGYFTWIALQSLEVRYSRGVRAGQKHKRARS